MKEIKHYLLPEVEPNLYENEARSSLALAEGVAKKLNELIDAYNELNFGIAGKENEQDGRIDGAVLYMKDNLANAINDLFENLKASGELSSLIDEALTNYNDLLELHNPYYDEITCEHRRDEEGGTDYYVTKIPREYKLEVGIANDSNNGIGLESTLDFAHRHNATLVVNAGVFNTETGTPLAFLVKDYKFVYTHITPEVIESDKYQYLGFRADGSYKVYPINTAVSRMLEDGMKDVICIFGSLVEEGMGVEQFDERLEPRQAIGFDKAGNITIITCDGRTSDNAGLSYEDLVRLFILEGCYNAYILDGGGSTSTILRGVKQNDNIDFLREDRKVNTFLYVKKDTNIEPINNFGNMMGDLKQELLNEIIKGVVQTGIIKLAMTEGNFTPRMDFYVNGNLEDRKARFGLSFDPNEIRNSYLYAGLNVDGTENTRNFRIYNNGTWVKLYSGPSSERPNGVEAGLCYFDTSLGKPIFYDGSKWVDANGTSV